MVRTTEAEGRREPAKHGVLACLARGEGGEEMYNEMRECFDIYYIRKSFHTFEKIRKGSGTKYVRMFSHILYVEHIPHI